MEAVLVFRGRRGLRRQQRVREQVDRSVQRAQESLDTATCARQEEEVKRADSEALVARLDRLAGDDSNHLGQLVLDALTERYRRKT